MILKPNREMNNTQKKNTPQKNGDIKTEQRNLYTGQSTGNETSS